jgi:hypothetical protein
MDRGTERARAAALVGVLALAGMLAPPARPHAAWPTHYSHRVTVEIEGARLAVGYVVEVPVAETLLQFNELYADRDLVAEIRDGRIEELEERFRLHQLERAAEALSVEVGGRALDRRLRPVDTPVNGRAVEGFFVYLLELEAGDLERGAEIVVRNDLLPGRPAVFANLVQVRGPWRVVSVSTPQPPPGTDLTVGSAAEMELWSTDESRRELRVVVEPEPEG